MTKINNKILSIPPYISTSWNNIKMLHVKEIEGKSFLIVVLHNETMIEVPNLDKSTIEQVFEAHGKALEQEPHPPSDSLKQFQPNRPVDASFSFGFPFNVTGTEALDNPATLVQHNPDQKNMPNLPSEILSKIAAITKTLGMNMDQMDVPKAEPHCNCVYCQIARAVQNEESKEPEEEMVSDEDLIFRDWEIKQEGDKLYIVTNPLDKDENYQVFLGSPVGCTCGKKACEHIQVVLKS